MDRATIELIKDARKRTYLSSDRMYNESKKISTKKLHANHFMCKGIYFLYYENEIVYVGQSKSNVMGRVCDHEREGMKIFDRFQIYQKYNLNDADLDELERKYIKKYNPKYNIVHNQIKEPEKENPNECKHIFVRYDKLAQSNFCSTCKRKIANKYYKHKDLTEKKRIKKHNSNEKYNDRYIKD